MGRAASEPAGRLITADLGNSRLSLVCWVEGRPRARAALSLDQADSWEPALMRWCEELEAEVGGPSAARVALASVAADAPTESARRALERTFAVDVVVHPEPGIQNTCRTPESVGMDRLYAARGALEHFPEGCVVLDAGTALTVDAVLGEGGQGRFLGGAIAPGPRLLAGSLAAGGARLFEIEPRPGVPALGRQTAEALEAGVVHGLRGAAFELSRRVGLEAGLAGAPRLLTGGAALLLLEPEPFWPGALRQDPDLVHLGLRLALAEAVER
jgi:type III pantothenate kinase